MRVPRLRFTVLAIMIVVAILAIVINDFRPIAKGEAEKIAEAHFLTLPGASQWVGRYKVHAWLAGPNRGDGWYVDFKGSGDGSRLAQMVITSEGKIKSSVAGFGP